MLCQMAGDGVKRTDAWREQSRLERVSVDLLYHPNGDQMTPAPPLNFNYLLKSRCFELLKIYS